MQMENKEEMKGVVLIKLPPPERPSEGKLIAGAFAFAGEHTPGQQEQEEEFGQEDNPQLVLPLHEVQSARHRRGWRHRKRHILPKHATSLIFLAIVGYFFYQYAPLSLQLEEEGPDSDPQDSEQLFVYKIYLRKDIVADTNASLAAEPLDSHANMSASVQSRDVERDIVHNNRVETASLSSGTFTTVFPVKGNVYPNGLYYVSVAVGNPPRQYYLDMDTGSDLTWLQCDAPCTHCAKGPHPLYKPRKNSLVDCNEAICSNLQVGGNFGCSGGSGQCDYEIRYADGGYSLGVLINDKMMLRLSNRSLIQTNAIFGCGYDQQGSLGKSPSASDGVLGLSPSIVSLPSQWAAQGLIKNIIAHCISSNGQEGGYLFFGDKLLPSRGIAWAPLLKNASSKHYMLAIKSVLFDNTKIPLTAGNEWGSVIFDSGTSYTYLLPSVYKAIVSTISKNLIGTGLMLDTSDNTLQLCWHGSSPFRSVGDAKRMFKPLILEFKLGGWYLRSNRLHISPEGYLIVNSKGNICLGILNADILGVHATNIIGDISMQGHLVVYDNENHQLGWIKTDCQKIPKTATLSPSL